MDEDRSRASKLGWKRRREREAAENALWEAFFAVVEEAGAHCEWSQDTGLVRIWWPSYCVEGETHIPTALAYYSVQEAINAWFLGGDSTPQTTSLVICIVNQRSEQ